MGLILDLVPNHMCIATSDNRWWNDVLENGRGSPYAPFFDIDWHRQDRAARKGPAPRARRAVRPRAREPGDLDPLRRRRLLRHYGDARYPIGPRTILPLLEPIVEDLRRNHPDDHPDLLEMESIVTATKHLPKRWDTEPDMVRERQREKEIVKRRLDALASGSAAVRDALERSLLAINGNEELPELRPAGGAARRPGLPALFWGVAAEEINYRRFFDINDLAAIRVEEPNVLEAVHDKPFELLRQGKVTGLRIDHVDGLLDPRRYLENLQRLRGGDADGADDDTRTTYVVVEKILTGDETLPAEWPVHGTTGYDFLNIVNGLLVDPAGARAIERFYMRLREGTGGFDDLLYRAKKLILRTAMSSELYEPLAELRLGGEPVGVGGNPSPPPRAR